MLLKIRTLIQSKHRFDRGARESMQESSRGACKSNHGHIYMRIRRCATEQPNLESRMSHCSRSRHLAAVKEQSCNYCLALHLITLRTDLNFSGHSETGSHHCGTTKLQQCAQATCPIHARSGGIACASHCLTIAAALPKTDGAD